MSGATDAQSMNTPVAFLIFNRPNTTQRVFEAIRQAKPSKLLVVADGPRSDRLNDIEKCAAVRAIIETVDWDCEVLKNYSDVNLGCKSRVSSGLDWVFEQVEEAIILEDDCLPEQSFFPFCEELLERYRDDQRIMVISGNNFQFDRKRTEYSYYFSIYNHCWGWATWRRAWQYYDVEMKQWSKSTSRELLQNFFSSSWAIQYWHNKFDKVYQNLIDTWDYQWTFTCWLQNGLSILPEVNLVKNIGFNSQGTHTKNIVDSFSNLETQPLQFPLRYPPHMIRCKTADQFTQKTQFGFFSRSINKLNSFFNITIKAK